MAINFFYREHTKTSPVLERKWAQVREKIHARWWKLTDEDIEQINGNHERFINLLMERYGITKETAEEQLQQLGGCHYQVVLVFFFAQAYGECKTSAQRLISMEAL